MQTSIINTEVIPYEKKKERLKILLIILIALFFVLGISAVAISGYKKHIVAEKEKQEMLEILQKMPKATPTPAATATPTPEPTATPTPTPVITMRATFNPDDYWNTWYSADGLVSLNIYNISNKSVSFSFSQANRADGAHVCEADVTAEVAGNAATFSFNDSFGSSAAGSLTFDGGNLYVNIRTEARAEGTAVSPEVSGLFTREKKEAPKPEPTATPVPEEKPEKKPEETEKAEGIIFSLKAIPGISQTRRFPDTPQKSWSLPKTKFMQDAEDSSSQRGLPIISMESPGIRGRFRRKSLMQSRIRFLMNMKAQM